MVSRELEGNQVQGMDFDRFKTDHRAVLAVLSLRSRLRHSAKPGVNLRGCQTIHGKKRFPRRLQTGRIGMRWRPLLLETAKAHKMTETKMLTVTDLELKTLLLQKKREGQHLERAELNRTLPRNLAKAESAGARETSHRDQGECRDGESPKKTKSKHVHWSSIANQENPQTVLTSLFQDLFAIPADQLDLVPS